MAETFFDKISLSALVDGFSNYIHTVLLILRHPFRFPETLEVDGDEAFKKAQALIFYCITFAFFILVPIFAIHGVEVPKLTFLVRMLVQFAVYGLLLHLSLRLIGRSTKNIKASMVAYTYIVIIGAPLALVLEYPILLSFGPAALFGTQRDLLKLSAYYQEYPLLQIDAILSFIVIIIITVAVMPNWFSKTHRVGRVRAFLCMLIAGAIGSVIQIVVLNPMFLAAFEWVDKFLKYA